MSKEIQNSHLMRAPGSRSALKNDVARVKRLQHEHLSAIREMILGTQVKVSSQEIRGTDIPTETVFILAFACIIIFGVFVGLQVKK